MTVSPKNWQAAFDQEVRFALVMYGGVSLTIYMNGVAQEYLNLVRATATGPDGKLRVPGDLEGTQNVYRKLASALRPAGVGTADDLLRTRFMVDIASGSSAGGINAIFLGKALANGGSLQQLGDLWLDQAGIEDLINDTRGADKSEFAQKKPQSLLSCDGIYNKLLNAFNGMEPPGKPLQPEMDVFITATDLQGLELPIELSDMQVFEKRYKNVFHLRFAVKEDGTPYAANDFTTEMNAFLAFAARATSSFPVAFEPMRLEAMDRVASKKSNAGELLLADSKELKDFFPDYISPSGDAGYQQRAFGDGGDLDNKPFSYAVDTLANRTSDIPVRRIIAYIEPSPDLPAGNDPQAPPNFIGNALKAASTLHLAETIREDLQRVLDRNRLIERVQELTSQVAKDVETWKKSRKADGYLEGEKYKTRTLDDAIADRGPGYAGYYRLKIRAVTDDLSRLIVRGAQLMEQSDEFRAIRYIIREWRRQTYHEDTEKSRTNEFLLNFDLSYRERRLRFLLRQLDQWSSEGAAPDRRDAIRDLKQELNKIAKDYGDLRRTAEARGKDNLAFKEIEQLGLDQRQLRSLLGLSRTERTGKVQGYLANKNVTGLADYVKQCYAGVTIKAAKATEDLLVPDPALSEAAKKVRLDLRPFFYDYEYYDQVVFPIFYETAVGEAEPADIIRISPLDATSIIDEKNDPKGRRKLAGIVLGHFGAFLDRVWRKNDILWGRLDGAERIIACLIPRDSSLAKELIREAHLEIIQEHFLKDNSDVVKTLVTSILRKPRDSRDQGDLHHAIETYLDNPSRRPVDERVNSVFMHCMTKEQIYDHLKKDYAVNREFNPENTLDVLGRATQVLGKMLDDVGSSGPDAVGQAMQTSGKWVARIGSVFWSLVQVAVPGGLGHGLSRHWLKVLYAFEIALLFGSTIALSQPTQQFALTALIVTAATNLFIAILRDFMRTPRWYVQVPIVVLVLLFAALAAIGGLTVRSEFLSLSSKIASYLPWGKQTSATAAPNVP